MTFEDTLRQVIREEMERLEERLLKKAATPQA